MNEMSDIGSDGASVAKQNPVASTSSLTHTSSVAFHRKKVQMERVVARCVLKHWPDGSVHPERAIVLRTSCSVDE